MKKKMWEHKESGTMKMLASSFQTFILKKKKIVNTGDELFYVKKVKQNLVGHMMACLVHVTRNDFPEVWKLNWINLSTKFGYKFSCSLRL